MLSTILLFYLGITHDAPWWYYAIVTVKFIIDYCKILMFTEKFLKFCKSEERKMIDIKKIIEENLIQMSETYWSKYMFLKQQLQ